MELSADEIDDVLEDLPGGQSVKPATRRLRQELHNARRRGAQLLPAPRVPDMAGDIFYASPALVRPLPSEQPRRALVVCRQDSTGVTGVGVIAEGCQFSDGATVWRRLDEPGWELYDSPGAEPFQRAHCPALVTEIVWLDDADEPG